MIEAQPTAVARVTRPTGKTLLQGREYVNAASTDIRRTFAAHIAAQAKPKRTPKLAAVRA